MVKVFFNKKNNKFNSMTVSGHANFEDLGKDIVCAGISSIVFGALNGFDQLAKPHFDIKVEDNLIEVLAKSEACIVDKLLSFVYYQLNTVYLQYPKYVNITIMEV